MNPRVLIAAGILIAVQVAKTEDFAAVLRPVSPSSSEKKGTVRFSPSVLLKYDVQTRVVDLERPPLRSVNEVRAYDRNFSVDCKIPTSLELSFSQRIESGVNQTVSPGFESPAVPHAISFTRQSVGVGWTPNEVMTFTAKTGSSRTTRAARGSAQTALRVDVGTYLRPNGSVAISGNWIRERILGDNGSEAYADTFHAMLDLPLPQLPVSARVGAWSLYETFDGLPGAQFKMHEVNSELTWQLASALAISAGFLLDSIEDSSSLSSSSYQIYYAALTTQVSKIATFSIRVAREISSIFGSGTAPLQANYSETSARLELKLRSGKDFIPKVGIRLRKYDYAQRRNSYQDSLMSFSGELIF